MESETKKQFISYLKKKGLNNEQIEEYFKHSSIKDDYDIRISRFIPSIED